MLAAFSVGVVSPTVSKAHAKVNSAHLLSWVFLPCIIPEGDKPGYQPSKLIALWPRGFLSSSSLCRHLQNLNGLTHATSYDGNNAYTRV